MFDELTKKFLFQRRRESLAAARSERELAELIEAADLALLDDDERHTSATAKAVERALEPIIRHVGCACRDRRTDCRDCPYSSITRWHLVDGRTLCEVAKEITDARKPLKERRRWLEECRAELATTEERVELMRERYLVQLEENLKQSRIDLEKATADLAAAEKTVEEVERKHGIESK